MPRETHAQLIFDDRSQLESFKYHMWHRYRIWLLIRTIASVGLVITGTVLMITHGNGPMPVLMLMVGVFALLRPLIWNIMHSRNLRKLPGFGEKVHYTFSEKNITIHGTSGEAKIKWADLLESKVTKKGLLLYHSKKSYTWIPRSAFQNTDAYEQTVQWSPSP